MSEVNQLITEHLDIWTAVTKMKSGAGRGNGGGVTLYGINKLRELIFHLAADGLLVESEAKTSKSLLGDDVELVMGQAPPGAECNKNGDGTVFVKTGEFGELYPEVVEWTTKPLKLARDGDVLICVVGATIGKLNLAIECAIGRSVAAIRPNSRLDTKFLYYSLMPYTLRLRGGARGSAQGVIGKTELKAIEIRVPPTAEQHRIVAKVDELMALCDALERQTEGSLKVHQTLVKTCLATLTNSQSSVDLANNWARIEAHFDTLFTTEETAQALSERILQLGVRGMLLPQDDKDEYAGHLVDNLIKDRSKKRKRSRGAVGESTMIKPPFPLPKTWVWRRFGDLVEFQSELVKPDGFGDAYQIAPDLIEKGTGRLLNSRTVQEAGVQGPNNRFYEGQILYSKIRPSLSKAVIAPYDGLCSADMYPLNSLIDPEFLLLSILSEDFLVQVRQLENRIKMPKLNIESLSSIHIAVPPLSEQSKIVAKVHKLLGLCDRLALLFSATNQLTAKLADALTSKIH